MTLILVVSPVPNHAAWWQQHMGVNNLPNVVTQQCCDRKWNPRPFDRKSDAPSRHASKEVNPFSNTERNVPELMIPVLGNQPAGDVSHKPDARLPLLSATPAVTIATLNRAATNFAAW